HNKDARSDKLKIIISKFCGQGKPNKYKPGCRHYKRRNNSYSSSQPFYKIPFKIVVYCSHYLRLRRFLNCVELNPACSSGVLTFSRKTSLREAFSPAELTRFSGDPIAVILPLSIIATRLQ